MAPILRGYLTRFLAARVAAVLASGGVAVLPTDTIYGLHCAASRLDAVKRIGTLKGRSRGSGYILLAADAAMAERVVSRWPGEAREILSRLWPAPLTAILPARKRLPAAIAPGGAVAVRVPADAALRALVAAVGEPLVSTSANVSGGRPLARVKDIERAFPGLEAYVSRRGRSPAAPSTIVDFRRARPSLVRRGGVEWPVRREGRAGSRRRAPGGRQSGKPSKRRSL